MGTGNFSRDFGDDLVALITERGCAMDGECSAMPGMAVRPLCIDYRSHAHEDPKFAL